MKVKIITASILLFAVLVLFRPVVDNDFGWHYRYGEYIFNNHKILRENTFSYIMPAYQWANSYWLSDALIYVLYKYTGQVAFSLILSLLFAFFSIRLFMNVTDRISAGVVGVFLGAVILYPYLGWYNITARPLFYSSVFMLLLVYILQFEEKYIRYLPLMFLIWVNMHADFTLGLFVFGVYTIFRILEMYRVKKVNFILITSALLSVLITLVNPYGILLWETLLKETNPYQFDLISEWLPLSTKGSQVVYISNTLIAGFIMASAAAYALTKDKKSLWLIPVTAFFFLFSFRSLYFTRTLLLVGILSLVYVWGFIFVSLKDVVGIRNRKPLKILTAYLLVVLFLVSMRSFTSNMELSTGMRVWEKKDYPVAAVTYIKTNVLEGQMFNNYNWGGYLIWQLPEYKTFIDGRMTSWRDNSGYSVLEDYINMTYYPDKYVDKIDGYVAAHNIGWALDKKGSKFTNFLIKEKGWVQVYEDESAVLLIKPPNP